MFFLFFFFPISDRRPEIPVLAGGQGPNARWVTSLHPFQEMRHVHVAGVSAFNKRWGL